MSETPEPRSGSEAQESTWTVARVLRWAGDDFQKRGLAHYRLESEILLCHILGLDRVRLIVDRDRPLSENELASYRAAIVRRRAGEPSAYILGYREFFGVRFRVDSRVLIPRPDTEVLVETALAKTKHRKLFGRALDLCTGSGCVGLSFALQRPTWQITLSDLSQDALSVARENAQQLGTLWGLRFASGDLYEAIGPSEKFELITANPPYIPPRDIAELEIGVRDFEPRSALDGGPDGLDFYPRLAQGARRHLVPQGVLAVEVGAGQAEEVEKTLLNAGLTSPERFADLAGHERVVLARAPARPSSGN